MRCELRCIVALAAALWLVSAATAQPSRIEITPEHVLSINGKPTFTIGFTLPPFPEALGRTANSHWRSSAMPAPSSSAPGRWLTPAVHGTAAGTMLGLPAKRRISTQRPARECTVCHRSRNCRRSGRRSAKGSETPPGHPPFQRSSWSRRVEAADEPQWGKEPVAPLVRAYDIIHEEDPNHPVWIVQAPRGSVEELRPYNAAYDIGGVDIYPIGYPPGGHVVAAEPNKRISMVGDYTRKMLRVVDGRKPIWLTLQIAWSGVARPGKTLRFPTFPEQRFMTYEAIINGARGLVYFGGGLPTTLSEDDREYRWNWTYWDRVLRR